MRRSVFWISFSLSLLPLSACHLLDIEAPWDCLESEMAVPITCEEEVEEGLQELMANFDPGLQHLRKNPLGYKVGEILEVAGQKVTVAYDDEEVISFTWPEPLPFPVSEGELFEAVTEDASVLLLFDEGILWLHAGLDFSGPGVDHFRVGPYLVELHPGCQSHWGQVIDAVVVTPDGAPRTLAPGEIWERDGWTIRNYGMVSSPGSMECEFVVEGRYEGLITGHHVGPYCEMYETIPETPCTQEVSETNGKTFSWTSSPIGWETDRPYTVVEVSEKSFVAKEQEAQFEYIVEFSWPREFPFPIEEGETVVLREQWEWFLFETKDGILAEFSGFGFTFPYPHQGPDGSLSFGRELGCQNDGIHVPRLYVKEGDKEASLYPGEEETFGAWNVRLEKGHSLSGGECMHGGSIVEGAGSSHITAWTRFE